MLSVFQLITLSKKFSTFPLNHFRFHIHVTLVTVLSAGLAVFCFQQFTSRKYVLSLTRRQRKSEGCRSDLICFVSHIKFCLFHIVHFNVRVTQITSSVDNQLPVESGCFQAEMRENCNGSISILYSFGTSCFNFKHLNKFLSFHRACSLISLILPTHVPYIYKNTLQIK